MNLDSESRAPYGPDSERRAGAHALAYGVLRTVREQILNLNPDEIQGLRLGNCPNTKAGHS